MPVGTARHPIGLGAREIASSSVMLIAERTVRLMTFE
jgi:hypothetical protein